MESCGNYNAAFPENVWMTPFTTSRDAEEYTETTGEVKEDDEYMDNHSQSGDEKEYNTVVYDKQESSESSRDFEFPEIDDWQNEKIAKTVRAVLLAFKPKKSAVFLGRVCSRPPLTFKQISEWAEKNLGSTINIKTANTWSGKDNERIIAEFADALKSRYPLDYSAHTENELCQALLQYEKAFFKDPRSIFHHEDISCKENGK
jgi:hypothetical protein